MSLPYPKGRLSSSPPGPNDDPGRFEAPDFFVRCMEIAPREKTEKHLVNVKWFPQQNGKTVRVTSVNGVADKLRSVSNDVAKLPMIYGNMYLPSAGHLQMTDCQGHRNEEHGTPGSAIDINTDFSDYWLWRRGSPTEIAFRTKSSRLLNVMASFGAENGDIMTLCTLNIGPNCLSKTTIHAR